MKDLNDIRVCYVECKGNRLNGSQQSMLNLIDAFGDGCVKPYIVSYADWELIDVSRKKGYTTFVLPQKGMIIERKKLKFSTLIKIPAKVFYNHLSVLKAKKFLVYNHIQLVHINTLLAYDVWARAAKKAGIPYIYHIREFLDDDHNRILLDKDKFFNNIRNANSVIAISKSVKEKWDKRLGKSCDLVYNGLPIDNYLVPINKLKFFDNKINILFIGRVTESKGQLDAVKAIKELLKRGYMSINLNIIGYRGFDDYEINLKKYIENNNLGNNIKLLDYTYDMDNYKRFCQIGLTCSKAEAFGRVTVEYMLGGLATIGSNTGGTPELIDDMNTGLLYEFGNIYDLADKIEYYLKHREDMYRIAKEGQNQAIERFSIERTASEVMRIYNNLLGGVKLFSFFDYNLSFGGLL